MRRILTILVAMLLTVARLDAQTYTRGLTVGIADAEAGIVLPLFYFDGNSWQAVQPDRYADDLVPPAGWSPPESYFASDYRSPISLVVDSLSLDSENHLVQKIEGYRWPGRSRLLVSDDPTIQISQALNLTKHAPLATEVLKAIDPTLREAARTWLEGSDGVESGEYPSPTVLTSLHIVEEYEWLYLRAAQVYTRSATESDSGCGWEASLVGWLQLRPRPNLSRLTFQLSDCDGKGRQVLQPIGVIDVQDQKFLVA